MPTQALTTRNRYSAVSVYARQAGDGLTNCHPNAYEFNRKSAHNLIRRHSAIALRRSEDRRYACAKRESN